jgi:hypothetical protein
MKHIKKFEGFSTNEEINFKGIAAGAMMALMTACQTGEVNGESNDGYSGDMLVRRIEITGGKFNHFKVHGEDKQGNDVDFHTDNLTFNVGDNIHVDFEKEEAYPLNDRSNVAETR